MVTFFFDGEPGKQYACALCGAPCGPKTLLSAVSTEIAFRMAFPETWHLHNRMVTCGGCMRALQENLPKVQEQPWKPDWSFDDEEDGPRTAA